MKTRTLSRLWLAAGLAWAVAPAAAQGPADAASVRFTEAMEREVRRSVHLPGTVESRTSSLVAAEVAGLVERLAAREGDAVRRGDALAVLRRTNLALRLKQARGESKEAGARLDLARSNFERNRDLLESGVISEREYDDAYSELTAWQGRVDALDAEIEWIETDLERCVIRAPFDGEVVEKRTEVGQWIDVGDPVADLVALDQIEVRVEVAERYYPELRQGTRATVSFESIPGLSIEGEVSAVISRADAQARTFPIKLRIPNQDGRIGVGMLARVDLPLGEPRRATLVPKDAIVAQGPHQVVYRINDDDTVEPVGVAPGRGLGSWIVVEGPLAPGARVVTRGNERIRPGQAVAGSLLEYPLP
jgi:RND family efflux transporter MFP subunit